MVNNRHSVQDSQDLVHVAMGRKEASLVIRHGNWVCVQTGEVIANTDIAIIGERIAYVGPDASHAIGKKTKIIDANVPIAVTFNNASSFPIVNKTNYNATVTWPIGTNTINVAMTPS